MLSPVFLCGLMDCSLPGSSVYGIFQARKEDAMGFTISCIPICAFWFGSWVEKDQWLHNFSITTLTVTFTNRMVLWVITVSHGEGNGNPLQYSCLGNPIDTGAWPVTVHRITNGRTRLKQLSMHAQPSQGDDSKQINHTIQAVDMSFL